MRDGGWIILIAFLPALAVAAWGLSGIFARGGERRLGDGNSVESYGFDLSNLLIRRDLIAALTSSRDDIPALTTPAMMRGGDVAALNEEIRGKYLVSADRVIGVTINGESRAYPLRMLDWHEVVNDVVGGEPVAITYSPWTDSVAVFDRVVDGRVVEFAPSGLLYNANLLMYIRGDGAPGTAEVEESPVADHPPGDESLWSQMEARAVSGAHAAAGRTLTRLPVTLCRWDDWFAARPDTLVLARNPMPEFAERYDHRVYGPYFSQGRIYRETPVSPRADDGRPPMTPIVVLRAGGAEHVVFVPDLITAAGERGEWSAAYGGETIRFRVNRAEFPTVIATNEAGDSAAIAYAFWFGWFAAHPGGPGGPPMNADER